MAERPIRMCDSCGQVDDHPRHVYGTEEGAGLTAAAIGAAAIEAAPAEHKATIIGQVQDTTTLMKHLDCCAADGCPDATNPALLSCRDLLNAGAEGKTGSALVAHLTSQPTGA